MSTVPLLGDEQQWRYYSQMNASSKKAKVTPETRAEAQALSQLWASRPHPSQAQFGEMFDIGNQSAVGQFLRGEVPLSPKAANGFAKGLGCSVADFSPRIANLFAPSAISLEEALQCLASHLKLLDSSSRVPVLALMKSMVENPESATGCISGLMALLHVKAALLPMSTPEALKVAKPGTENGSTKKLISD